MNFFDWLSEDPNPYSHLEVDTAQAIAMLLSYIDGLPEDNPVSRNVRTSLIELGIQAQVGQDLRIQTAALRANTLAIEKASAQSTRLSWIAIFIALVATTTSIVTIFLR